MQNSSAGNIHKNIMPPLAFVACGDDALPTVLFRAKTPGGGFYFHKDRITVAMAEAAVKDEKGPVRQGAVLELSFLGAREDAAIKGEGETGGKLNYLIGNDPNEWRADLPVYEKLKYEGIWEGVGLEVFGDEYGLKFNWLLKKAGAAGSIRLHWEGIEELALSEEGSLLVRHPLGVMADTAPAARQVAGGREQKVGCSYRLLGGGDFGFSIFGEYDPDSPLVIDPLIPYSPIQRS